MNKSYVGNIYIYIHYYILPDCYNAACPQSLSGHTAKTSELKTNDAIVLIHLNTEEQDPCVALNKIK